MNVDSAKIILNSCTREELRDHAFGDVEIYWFKNGKEIAFGYFGGTAHTVSLSPVTKFEWAEARELRECGALGHVERNDMTGPDNFVEGAIMPGLTMEAVKAELTEPDFYHNDLAAAARQEQAGR